MAANPYAQGVAADEAVQGTRASMHTAELTDEDMAAGARPRTDHDQLAASPLRVALVLVVVGLTVAGWPLVLEVLGVDVPDRAAGIVGSFVQTGVAAVAGWMCLRASRVHTGRARAAWTLVCGAMWAQGLSLLLSVDTVGTTNTAGERLHPLDDLAGALGVLLVLVGLALFPRDRRRSSRVHRLNVAIVVASVLTLMWVLAADDAVSAVAGQEAYSVVVGFVVLNSLIIGFTASLVVRTRIDRRPDMRALASGMVWLVASSLTQMLVAIGNANATALRLVAGAAVVGNLLVAVAGRRSALGLQDEPRSSARAGLVQRWVPVVAVLVALPTVVVHEYVEKGADLPTLVLGGVCVALSIYRLSILERDQRRLAKDLLRVADRLDVEAHSDALTGLGNRAGLAAHLAAALERQAPSGIALFYIDVDHFKSVNDGLGHEGGDELLVEIGDRLRNVLGDHVFRLGGDEFVAVREDLDREQSEAVAAALVAAMEQPVHVLGRPLRAGVSVGLARSEVRREPEPSKDSGWPARRPDSPEAVLRRADLALYRAKELGRGRWASYDPWLQQRADRHLQMQQGLHRAVANHEIDVFFQPVVDLRTRETAGAEALVRWRSPDHGLVLPNDFLPAATHAGLLPEIGRLVIDAVESRLAEVGDSLSISVNLSPPELSHPAIVARLVDAAAHAPAGRLWVGVHEASVVDDTTGRTLRMLREHGVMVVVDGFGAGPSSLRHMADYPADAISVDRSFVDGLDTEDHDTTIVEAVAQLGLDLGLLLAAQGVTDERQAARLTGLGYRSATGWLFGRPMPWDDFLADRVALPADGPAR